MTKLPVVKARDLENVLFKLGFNKIRQKGSHTFYKHTDGRYTIIPHHPSKNKDILQNQTHTKTNP